MKKNELLIAQDLDFEFDYPIDYKNYLPYQRELDPTPWWLIGNTEGVFKIYFDFINIKNRSTKFLVPFAKSDEMNILACFDESNRVWFCGIEDDDIANANWNERYSMPSFSAWLERVLSGDL